MKKEYGAYFLAVARFLIAGIFMASGFSKLVRPLEYFEIAISLYKFYPDFAVGLIAHTVPWVELLAGIYLLLGFETKIVSFFLMLLTGCFQLTLAQALLRRIPIDDCGCFGGTGIHLSLYQSFCLDTVLVLILVQIVFADEYQWSLDRMWNRKEPRSLT